MLSPSYWAGRGPDSYKGGKASKTVSSSGYSESVKQAKSGLLKRTGNLKDVNEVQEMFRFLKQQNSGQVDVRDLLRS